MDFWKVVGVPVRRWYAVLPVLLIAVLTGAAAYLSGPPIYSSQATLVLTTPSTGGTQYADGYVPAPVNPLLMYDHGVALAGALLIQGMRTPEFEQRVGVSESTGTSLLISNGGESDYQLINGPFVQLVAHSSSPDDTQALVQRAVAAAREELARRQSDLGVPPSTYVTLTEVMPPTAPVGAGGSGKRAATVVLGLGGLVSVILAFVVESLLVVRRRPNGQRCSNCSAHSAASA